jgi:hypothetical protein
VLQQSFYNTTPSESKHVHMVYAYGPEIRSFAALQTKPACGRTEQEAFVVIRKSGIKLRSLCMDPFSVLLTLRSRECPVKDNPIGLAVRQIEDRVERLRRGCALSSLRRCSAARLSLFRFCKIPDWLYTTSENWWTSNDTAFQDPSF